MRAFLLRLSRITVYLAVTLLLVPVQAVLVAAKSPLAAAFPRLYHRLCCRILGFRIEAKGALSDRHPTLFVGNHISHIAHPILAPLAQGSFVPKLQRPQC